MSSSLMERSSRWMLPAGILSIGRRRSLDCALPSGIPKQCLLLGRSYLPSNFAGVGLELSGEIFCPVGGGVFLGGHIAAHLVQYGPQDDGGFWRWGRLPDSLST